MFLYVPGMHALHVTSLAMEPVALGYCPLGHCDHAMQLLWPVTFLKKPLRQGAQTRSDVAVTLAVISFPMPHVWPVLHVICPGRFWNWLAVGSHGVQLGAFWLMDTLPGEQDLQPRSEVGVRGLETN